ncbi:MAG: hypothetical protein PHT12_03755 [Patescibacteria group bacterium]|nr:hypothetical protein [Patescibacteria group bacterium]
MSSNAYEIGTMENPCTSENSSPADHGYKYCLCDECLQTALCTPNYDFCVCADGKLRCPSCFFGFCQQAVTNARNN